MCVRIKHNNVRPEYTPDRVKCHLCDAHYAKNNKLYAHQRSKHPEYWAQKMKENPNWNARIQSGQKYLAFESTTAR